MLDDQILTLHIFQGESLSPGSIGLPTQGLPTPTSTVYNLTKDLEQSLDLKSATAGNRVVTAKQVTDRFYGI